MKEEMEDKVAILQTEVVMNQFRSSLKEILEENEACLYERGGILYAASRYIDEHNRCKWAMELGTSVSVKSSSLNTTVI